MDDIEDIDCDCHTHYHHNHHHHDNHHHDHHNRHHDLCCLLPASPSWKLEEKLLPTSQASALSIRMWSWAVSTSISISRGEDMSISRRTGCEDKLIIGRGNIGMNVKNAILHGCCTVVLKVDVTGYLWVILGKEHISWEGKIWGEQLSNILW